MGYYESMFLFRETDPSGPWVISQNSHAWMAWQIARHWGNRGFPRASIRGETEAAVLLHDSGWTEYDRFPELDEDGRIRTFDRMRARAHLQLWRESVARAEDLSRYAANLVAAHFVRLSRRKSSDLIAAGDVVEARKVKAFEAEMEGLRAGWRESMIVDSRYAEALEGPGFEINSMILSSCDRLAVFFCASMSGGFDIEALDAGGVKRKIRLRRRGPRSFSLSPWPFEGSRFKVHCDMKRLRSAMFRSREDCGRALNAAPVERLGIQLFS